MENQLKIKLKNNEQVIGTFFSMGNADILECLGYTSLDYVIIDTEHGPFDTETIMDFVRAAECVNLTPMIRIADVTHKEIQRAVDSGAKGIVIPYLKTLDDIKKIIEFAKFPPTGNRGFIQGRASGFGYKQWAKDINEWMNISNQELLVLPQCETVQCLEVIEHIVEMEGIDGIFVGPFDLSISMGIPAQFENERFLSALERILKACKNVHKPAFIFAADMKNAQKYMKWGFEGIAYGIDTAVVIEAYQNIVKQIRQIK
mgnify:FL=1